MDRNRLVAGRYVVDFMSRPKHTPEELERFFQEIIDDTKGVVCEEIRDYIKGNLVSKLDSMVDRIDMEIEAAIQYLDDKVSESPDQLKLQL